MTIMAQVKKLTGKLKAAFLKKKRAAMPTAARGIDQPEEKLNPMTLGHINALQTLENAKHRRKPAAMMQVVVGYRKHKRAQAPVPIYYKIPVGLDADEQEALIEKAKVFCLRVGDIPLPTK